MLCEQCTHNGISHTQGLDILYFIFTTNGMATFQSKKMSLLYLRVAYIKGVAFSAVQCVIITATIQKYFLVEMTLAILHYEYMFKATICGCHRYWASG